MKLYKRLISVMLTVVLLALPICVTGCDNSSDEGYSLYYRNEEGTGLEVQKYQTDTKDTSELINELLEAMRFKDSKQAAYSVIPKQVVVKKVDIKGGTANLYFDAVYNDMDSVAELLFRAGIVRAVTQIKDIYYVQFYVDDAPVQYADGSLMGLLEAGDFIDDSDGGMYGIKWKEVDFYYANELGDKLVKNREKVAYSKNVSFEKLVVEKLINGPTDKNMQSTLPANMKVLNVTVSDRVCYVNLDAKFLTEMVNVASEIPVYSIVNTVCSMGGIDSVVILVNGDTTKAYRDTVRLDKKLIFNHDIIENKANKSNYQVK